MTSDNEPIYLYHHNNQWMCFEGELPVKPNEVYANYYDKLQEYNQAIATLKSKALPVANPEILDGVVDFKTPIIVVDDWNLIKWGGTVELIEKCVTGYSESYGEQDAYVPTSYILHLPKPKKIHNNIPPLPEYFYIEGPDEFVKGDENLTEQQRIEKEAEDYAKSIGNEDGTTAFDYISGANATRLRYVEQVKQILERANDKGMFYYDSVIKEIEKL